MTSESIAVDVEGVSKRYAHRVKGEVYAARDVVLHVKPHPYYVSDATPADEEGEPR